MDGDIFLEQDRVIVEGEFIEARVHDLMLNSPQRITEAPHVRHVRRALVHDFGDGLTINYNRDYPGGVKVLGQVTVEDEILVTPKSSDPKARLLNPHPINVGLELQSLRAEINVLKNQLAALIAKVGP